MKVSKYVYLFSLLFLISLVQTTRQTLDISISGGGKLKSNPNYHVELFVDVKLSEETFFKAEFSSSTVETIVSFSGVLHEFRKKISFMTVYQLVKIVVLTNQFVWDVAQFVSSFFVGKGNIFLNIPTIDIFKEKNYPIAIQIDALTRVFSFKQGLGG